MTGTAYRLVTVPVLVFFQGLTTSRKNLRVKNRFWMTLPTMIFTYFTAVTPLFSH